MSDKKPEKILLYRFPAWTLALVAVTAKVEKIEDGPCYGYEGSIPRVRITWGEHTCVQHESYPGLVATLIRDP